MRVAGAVGVAHVVGAMSLLPFGEGDCAHRAVFVGELEGVLVQVGGFRPGRGIGEAATNGDATVGVGGVSGEGVGNNLGRAHRASAGGDGEGVGADPESVVEGVGATVVGAAKFAFGVGVVSSAAEAIAWPDASAEGGGDDASLERREGARVR